MAETTSQAPETTGTVEGDNTPSVVAPSQAPKTKKRSPKKDDPRGRSEVVNGVKLYIKD